MLCLFDRRLAEVSPVLRHRALGLLARCQPCIAFNAMAVGLCQVSSPILLAPTTLQPSLQVHSRHTADRFRLIAHIEKEPTASSSCGLTYMQR